MKIKIAFAALLLTTLLLLNIEGRNWWCACGESWLWSSDIWSAHCSQHLVDPYSFTHILHGVIFCIFSWALLPKTPFAWRLWIATLIECAWEVAENSAYVIHRYREVTISLGYEGDSILNTLGDIACCMIGFALAQSIGLRRSVVAFVVTEMTLLLTIRDNLTLNVLMLLCPIESVKTWQMLH